MSITNSLANAISGLSVNARKAEIVSSNIANALTDGYGRRDVQTGSTMVGGQGAGVRVTGITRMVDKSALSDRRMAESDLNLQQRNASYLTRLEQIFGKPDDPAAVGGRLAALENALLASASDSASTQRLGAVLSRLTELTNTLNTTAVGIQQLRQEADADIARDIEVLNTSLKEVERINADIGRLRATGGDPSTLEDARQVAIDRIATIVPVRELQRQNGQIALMTPNGELLLDGPAREYGFNRTPTIVGDMSLATGSLSGITRDGVPLVPDGLGKLTGGSLEAAFRLRDVTLVEAQASNDLIALDLITRFADPATDPTLAPGDAGLLTDNGAAYDPLDFIDLSRRLRVNAAVDPTRGGDLTRLRDGVNATTPGPVGDPAQINRWSAALATPITLGGGTANVSAAGRIAEEATRIGTLRIDAERNQGFSSARWESMRSAELAGGVDTDQELQSLLQIEQAYAANARLIQTVQAMLQSLMEI